MRAVTIEPGRVGSLRLEERPDPVPRTGQILARTMAVGVCGTDRELIEGRYGEAPPGHERLQLGHESLARVVEAPAGSGFAAGDMVVGIVCLAGLGAAHAPAAFDFQAFNRSLVLGNRVVFGSVNANRRHYLAAAAALARADRGWLERLITRRVPLAAWREAYERRPGDVKTVLTFAH